MRMCVLGIRNAKWHEQKVKSKKFLPYMMCNTTAVYTRTLQLYTYNVMYVAIYLFIDTVLSTPL